MRRRVHIQHALMLALALLAAGGMGIARALYPAENHFSVMTCTLSFLGSPDAHRNPTGWRYWQAGMMATLLLLAILAGQRVGKRLGQPGWLVAAASTAYLGALALIGIAALIPVSRETLCAGATHTAIHNRATLAGIVLMAGAVMLDGISLRLARARLPLLAPFAVFGVVAACGLTSLTFWRWKCAANPALRFFPGEGIHSTPLWEWIAFACLCLLLVYQVVAGSSAMRESVHMAKKRQGHHASGPV